MTVIIILLYLLVLVYIAFKSYFSVRNHNDFFVARKSGTYWTVTGSLIATILGGSAIIGSIDAGPKMGWATAWFMLCASIGLFALIPLSKRVSRLGKFTLPDLLKDLYGSNSKKIASFIIPIAWIGIIAAQIIASARILNSFISLNYEIGVLLSGLVFIGYTIAGGQISVLKTDFVQSFLILAGIITIGLFVYLQKDSFKITLNHLKFPFNNNFKPLDLVILLITYASTFTAGPDIYSRIFCAKNEKIAQKAVASTAIILIPVAFIIGYISFMGSGLSSNMESGARIIEISQLVLPNWLIPLIVIALLSAILSSADTTLLSTSIIITDLLEKNNFGTKTLIHTRITILVVGIISMVIALNFTSIIGMLLIALSVYSASFILPILVGLMGFTIHIKHVSAAMLCGGTIAFTGKMLLYTEWSSWSNPMILAAFFVNGVLLLTGYFRKKYQKK